jgi:hypothetical protein
MRLAPLRSHSPWTQQKQTNLHHICHSAAVPKAALRGPSTSSTDSPASQHQTLFFSAALSLPLPYTGNNDNAKGNKLHRTKQDRNTNHRQNSFPPPLRSQPHLPDATVERLTTRTIASHHPMPHMITLSHHTTLPIMEKLSRNRNRHVQPQAPQTSGSPGFPHPSFVGASLVSLPLLNRADCATTWNAHSHGKGKSVN